MRHFITLTLIVLLTLVFVVAGCGRRPGQGDYEKAIRELQAGQYVRAKALLEISINKQPGLEINAPAYNYLGIACVKLGLVEEAIGAFEDSRRLNPAYMPPVYNLGMLYYRSGDIKRATVLLEDAGNLEPNDPAPLEALGNIYWEVGVWEKAAVYFQEALNRTPESASVLNGLALVKLRTNGPAEAIAGLMQALERKSDYAPAIYNLAMIYLDYQDDPAQAKAFFEQFLQYVNKGPQAEFARLALVGVARPVAGPTPAGNKPEVLDSKKLPGSEVKKTADSKKNAPISSVVAPRIEGKKDEATIEDILVQARLAAEKGQAQNSLALFLQAAEDARVLKLDSMRERVLKDAVNICFDQSRAYYAYGNYLREKEQYRQALELLKQAVGLSPDWSAAQLALSDVAINLGEYDTALIALKKANSLDSSNPDALWKLGCLYSENLNADAKAEQSFNDFVRLFPDDPRVLEARQRIQDYRSKAAPIPVATQQPVASKPAVTAVMAPVAANVASNRPAQPTRNPRAAIQAYNRGTLYHSREDWDGAAYFYERAIENDDTFVKAYYNLGGVYRAKGDLDKAKVCYEKAIALEPKMVNAYYNVALVCCDLGLYKEAESYAKTALKLEPTNPFVHQLLGLIYARDPATLSLAIDHYQMFIKLAPNDPAAAEVQRWLQAQAR